MARAALSCAELQFFPYPEQRSADKWGRSYAYVNAAHNALPRKLNQIYDEAGVEKLTGVLLHTKFLPDAADRARQERNRQQHFSNSMLYDAVSQNPDLWEPGSTRYLGW